MIMVATTQLPQWKLAKNQQQGNPEKRKKACCILVLNKIRKMPWDQVTQLREREVSKKSSKELKTDWWL